MAFCLSIEFERIYTHIGTKHSKSRMFIVCFVLYVPQKVVALDDFFNLIVRGFADMLPILILLVIAFVLQKVTEGMGMTDFIISVAKPLLWGPVFPAIAFVLVAALTFTTGSLWGMSAVVAPIVFPG